MYSKCHLDDLKTVQVIQDLNSYMKQSDDFNILEY